VSFDYYSRLGPRQRAIVEKSDRVGHIELTDLRVFEGHVRAIEAGLAGDDRMAVQRASTELVRALLSQLRVRPIALKVLAKRPRSASEELHGLYVRDLVDKTAVPVVHVWMRTAAHKRPVAPRTFLRTLLHELCHHLDYELLRLADTFHTRGFFRRESSLVRQLLGESPRRRRRDAGEAAPTDAPALPATKKRRRKAKPANEAPDQLDLF
jgi:hypothetical protein